MGISADSVESHRAFADRLGGLPFPLASDAKLEVSRQYGVVDETGRRSKRAIFVIEKDGTIMYSNTDYRPGNVGQYMQVFQALGLG